MTRAVKLTAAIALIIFAWYLVADRVTPFTANARVKAIVVPIVPQVSGYVTGVSVTNSQMVEVGANWLSSIPPSILDNLSSHKSAYAAEVLKSIGAWFLFLPSYSPDLNPIEMAFAKLKALIRKAAARSYDALWQAVGAVCDLFSDEECYNYFKAAGYEAD
jgi:hypothetical protein